MSSSGSGTTDICPGCAHARAGRKQAVDHSEQGRSRVETILSTTTEGQMRLYFAQYAEAVRLPGEVQQCKRYRPEGGRREAMSCKHSEATIKQVAGTAGGSFMPAEGVPSSPTSPQTAKRGLEQEEAAMTDVPTEARGRAQEAQGARSCG